MAKPWPKFITPRADPQKMRPDKPRPEAGTNGAQRTFGQPRVVVHKTQSIGPTTVSAQLANRPKPKRIPERAYAVAELKRLLADSTRGGDAKPGYNLRVKHIRAKLAAATIAAPPLAPPPRPA